MYESKKPGFWRSLGFVLAFGTAVAFATNHYQCSSKKIHDKAVEYGIKADQYLESNSPQCIKDFNEWARENIHDRILGKERRQYNR